MAATVTVGVLAAAAVGVITVIPSTTTPRHASPKAVAPAAAQGLQVIFPAANISAPLGIEQAPDEQVLGNAKKDAAAPELPPAGGGGSSNGCHGNVTGAPPAVPVGPRGAHPHGPPVNPPKGGCKNL